MFRFQPLKTEQAEILYLKKWQILVLSKKSHEVFVKAGHLGLKLDCLAKK